MRHLIKYVLVTAVLLFGLHTASRFKASPPQQSAANVAESEAAVLSSHPDAQPTNQSSDWQVPAAALSDTERSAVRTIEPESHDEFERPTLQGQPTIEGSSRLGSRSAIVDWSATENSWWDQEPSGGETASTDKLDANEESMAREKAPGKGPRVTKKGRSSDKHQTTGKARNDKKTSRPADSTGNDRSNGADDKPWGQAKSADTPKWPVGDRLASAASSYKTTVSDQSLKDRQGSWHDKYGTSARRPSPFERSGDEEQDTESSSSFSQEDDQKAVPNRGNTRQRKKPAQPEKVEPRPGTADKSERHRIVDGDTLPKLAQAYFGDRDRYLDIFQANRGVLSDPRLLPIGVELAIPANAREQNSGRRAAASTDRSWETKREVEDDDQMVPIPTFALPARISR
ncbi:MAG: hypothetical protein H8E44_15090 [Planctomycetes bacterium]|nr:hypothetical protein [Planctomycetota bacterium]MBL7042363.1 hypothetical protein [Pirellulaceae bacterium]